MQRNLLYFPCRHYVEEISLKSAFGINSEEKIGPNDPLFVEFQKYWKHIDRLKYTIGINDKSIAKIMKNDKAELINFIKDQFEVLDTWIYSFFIHFFLFINCSIESFMNN